MQEKDTRKPEPTPVARRIRTVNWLEVVARQAEAKAETLRAALDQAAR